MKTQQNIGVVIFSFITIIFATQVAFSSVSTEKMNLLKKNVEKAYYGRYVDPINISVSEPGNVVLKGTVNTFWDKLNIFSIVAKINGVKTIQNDLTVNTDSVPDNIIKDEMLRAYRFNRVILEPDSIHVVVNNGMVILTGTVNFNKESIAAGDIAGWWKGVKNVDNELTIKSPVKATSDENLTALVKDVLKDNFSIGAKNVDVKVSQGIVTLTGTIENYWLKYAIKRELYNILGVRGVTEELTVEPKDEY